MFFEDHEKLIYTPTGSDKQFDPLAIDRVLKVETANKLAQLVLMWQAIDSDEGDISESGKLQTIKLSCRAEEALARAARVAFGLPDFPDCTDGTALEMLCDYLDWIKKKGKRENTTHPSTTSEPVTPFQVMQNL